MTVTVPLDAEDLAVLANTGVLEVPAGDRTIVLHTRPRPTANPLWFRLDADTFDSLHESSRVAFSRRWPSGWVRIVLILTPALEMAR